jgi:hypothetical protein
VDILQELLHGAIENEAPPHDGVLLVGQEAHGQDPQGAGPDAPFERDHLLVPCLDLPLHPEEARHAEPPDVGVEHAHRQAAPG